MSACEMGDGGDCRAVLIYNPLPFARTEIVRVSVWDTGEGWATRDPAAIAFAARGPDGTACGAQAVERGDYWGHRFVKLAFPASVPALGYALYTIEESASADPWASSVAQYGPHLTNEYFDYEQGPVGLGNEHTLVELDTRTGGIRRLVDKRTGRVVIDGGCGAQALEWGCERTARMDAWMIQPTGGWRGAAVRSMTRRLEGPYAASIEVAMRVRSSDLCLTYELRAGDPAVYLHIEGDWREYWTEQDGAPVLRLSLPLAARDLRAMYEIPFGAIERDMRRGEEVPSLRWAAATGRAATDGGPSGIYVVNDSKHGFSVEGNRLNVSLIRGTHDPDPLPEVGRHEVHVALRPLSAPLPVEECMRMADAFDHELKAVSTDAHRGTLPREAGLVELDNPSVLLSSLKAAEDGNGLVLRLVNPTARDQEAVVTFGNVLCREIANARYLDVNERGQDGDMPVVEGRTVRAIVEARSFVSVAVTPAQ